MTTIRASCWSVTINNPTPADEEQINLARQKGWKVEGQLETGVEGTRHYQLCVRTPQVRFSALKKAFSRAHIEVARNEQALAQYVVKEETRTGSLLTSQEKYPSLSKYYDLIWETILANPTVSEFHRPGNRFSNPNHALVRATALLIRQGYYVESFATNPMIINSWKLFHDSFLYRKETASQTDTCVQSNEDLELVYNKNAHSEVLCKEETLHQEVSITTWQDVNPSFDSPCSNIHGDSQSTDLSTG